MVVSELGNVIVLFCLSEQPFCLEAFAGWAVSGKRGFLNWVVLFNAHYLMIRRNSPGANY